MTSHDASLQTTQTTHRSPSSKYALPGNEEERSRLTGQHEFLKHTFGGKILLSPVALKEGDEVLDACTGTGIWLLDLAKEVPEGVQLEGIDIDPRLFPLEESRPKNVNFTIHSVLSFPSEWTNRFSAVHQRLLLLGLHKEEWPLALSELYRVTKPGGWAELCEFTKWKGGATNNRLWNLWVTALDRIGYQGDCGQALESMMRAAGFEDVEVVVRSCPIGKWGGEHGVMLQNSHVRVFEVMKTKILNVAKDLIQSKEEFEKLIDEDVKEHDTVLCTYQWVICFGRKPSH